ncbi:MAG: glutamine-synthetase adenylyltransferase, partial [Rhodospirillaceae bacterium]|nr:glutamine-synthetase adenylyltransferase [Rhodospirillaceae bacterium]
MSESPFHRLSTPPSPSDQDMLARNLERWSTAVDEELEGEARLDATRLLDSRNGRLLRACFGNSPFLSECLLKHPDFALACFTVGYDAAIRSALEDARKALAATGKIESVARILRVARRQVALGIALADLSGAWVVPAITATLSDFADWAIGSALEALLREAAGRNALTLDPKGLSPTRSCGVFVIGMGKLGAHELNYSSDIDLIVFFDPEVVPIARPERLQREMVRLTQGLVDLLHK